LAKLQFPWRFNTLTTFATAALIAFSLDYLLRKRNRLAITLATGLCVAIAAGSMANAALLNVQSRFLHPHRFSDETGIETLLPTYAKSTPVDWVRKNQAVVRASELVQASPAGVKTAWHRTAPQTYGIAIDAPEWAAVKIRQLYYPAWKATLESGRDVPLRPSSPEGYLTFDIEPGAHRLTLQFQVTPSEILGGYVSLATSMVLGVMLAAGRLRGRPRSHSALQR
jgi:hypothetical protein